MTPAAETGMAAVAKEASDRLGGLLRPDTTRPIESGPFKDVVVDSTQAFFVDGVSRRKNYVMIVSNPIFPGFVDRAVGKSFEARSVLGPALGKAICTPLLAGAWNGRSYALYERLIGYSENRYLRRLQTLRSGGRVISWLAAVFRKTAVVSAGPDDRERRFLVPLRALSSDRNLDDTVRKAALAMESALDRGRLRTFSCLEHGDFWTENILFADGGNAVLPVRRDFRVIDWGGSNPAGYPGIDALRFSLSAFGRGRLAADRLGLYCRLTGLTGEELGFSCLCALGRLSLNLDQFPKHRFDRLAAHTTGFLGRHGYVAMDGA
ncbi:hypothetical protein OCGS_2756 [Oceaniovalibus guishaninsula JLT2003]|uniref:Aminoglycoside phosphotransferase domain-containing protein n=1 Tax=Oceaniovalibus guishaninsula JLT2003 TaxID=1231392 RepID=K2I2U3_9RHOB|nr:hypothetical protein [Oceaniovalibus guishaninsula]EKE43165.1 hypothetical protein OCGS_2756 [Oceaniovalibus guishaninsula JLT2003]